MKIINYVITILLVASPLYAADGKAPAAVPSGKSNGSKTIPAAIPKFIQALKNEVQNKERAESGNSEIKFIQYGDKGRLDTVTYDDGMTVKYSYKTDKNGDLTSCTLNSTNGVAVEFKNTGKVSQVIVDKKPGKEPKREAVSKGDAVPTEPISITVSAPQDLEKISRTPVKFDFDEIGKVIDEASKKKNEAHNNYITKTVDYYKNVADVLNKVSGSLAAEGINADINAGDLEKKSAPEKREIIDKAVAYIRTEAAKDPDQKPAAVTFLRAEETYRADFLEPYKKVYDYELREAMANVNAVIEKLIKSKIAVYLNKDDDKIDAVINLPANPGK